MFGSRCVLDPRAARFPSWAVARGRPQIFQRFPSQPQNVTDESLTRLGPGYDQNATQKRGGAPLQEFIGSVRTRVLCCFFPCQISLSVEESNEQRKKSALSSLSRLA